MDSKNLSVIHGQLDRRKPNKLIGRITSQSESQQLSPEKAFEKKKAAVSLIRDFKKEGNCIEAHHLDSGDVVTIEQYEVRFVKFGKNQKKTYFVSLPLASPAKVAKFKALTNESCMLAVGIEVGFMKMLYIYRLDLVEANLTMSCVEIFGKKVPSLVFTWCTAETIAYSQELGSITIEHFGNSSSSSKKTQFKISESNNFTGIWSSEISGIIHTSLSDNTIHSISQNSLKFAFRSPSKINQIVLEEIEKKVFALTADELLLVYRLSQTSEYTLLQTMHMPDCEIMHSVFPSFLFGTKTGLIKKVTLEKEEFAILGETLKTAKEEIVWKSFQRIEQLEKGRHSQMFMFRSAGEVYMQLFIGENKTLNFSHEDDYVSLYSVSPNRKWALVYSRKNIVRIFCTRTLGMLAVGSLSSQAIKVSLSDSGIFVLSLLSDGSLEVCEIKPLEDFKKVAEDFGVISHETRSTWSSFKQQKDFFNPEDQNLIGLFMNEEFKLIVSVFSRAVKVYFCETKKTIEFEDFEQNDIQGCNFSHEDHLLATWSQKSVKILSLSKMKLVFASSVSACLQKLPFKVLEGKRSLVLNDEKEKEEIAKKIGSELNVAPENFFKENLLESAQEIFKETMDWSMCLLSSVQIWDKENIICLCEVSGLFMFNVFLKTKRLFHISFYPQVFSVNRASPKLSILQLTKLNELQVVGKITSPSEYWIRDLEKLGSKPLGFDCNNTGQIVVLCEQTKLSLLVIDKGSKKEAFPLTAGRPTTIVQSGVVNSESVIFVLDGGFLRIISMTSGGETCALKIEEPTADSGVFISSNRNNKLTMISGGLVHAQKANGDIEILCRVFNKPVVAFSATDPDERYLVVTTTEVVILDKQGAEVLIFELQRNDAINALATFDYQMVAIEFDSSLAESKENMISKEIYVFKYSFKRERYERFCVLVDCSLGSIERSLPQIAVIASNCVKVFDCQSHEQRLLSLFKRPHQGKIMAVSLNKSLLASIGEDWTFKLFDVYSHLLLISTEALADPYVRPLKLHCLSPQDYVVVTKFSGRHLQLGRPPTRASFAYSFDTVGFGKSKIPKLILFWGTRVNSIEFWEIQESKPSVYLHSFSEFIPNEVLYYSKNEIFAWSLGNGKRNSCKFLALTKEENSKKFKEKSFTIPILSNCKLVKYFEKHLVGANENDLLMIEASPISKPVFTFKLRFASTALHCWSSPGFDSVVMVGGEKGMINFFTFSDNQLFDKGLIYLGQKSKGILGFCTTRLGRSKDVGAAYSAEGTLMFFDLVKLSILRYLDIENDLRIQAMVFGENLLYIASTKTGPIHVVDPKNYVKLVSLPHPEALGKITQVQFLETELVFTDGKRINFHSLNSFSRPISQMLYLQGEYPLESLAFLSPDDLFSYNIYMRACFLTIALLGSELSVENYQSKSSISYQGKPVFIERKTAETKNKKNTKEAHFGAKKNNSAGAQIFQKFLKEPEYFNRLKQYFESSLTTGNERMIILSVLRNANVQDLFEKVCKLFLSKAARNYSRSPLKDILIPRRAEEEPKTRMGEKFSSAFCVFLCKNLFTRVTVKTYVDVPASFMALGGAILSEKPWLDISSRSELIGFNDTTTKKVGCAVYRSQLDVFNQIGSDENFIHLLEFIRKSSSHDEMLLGDPRISKMIDFYWGPQKYWIFSNIVFTDLALIMLFWFIETAVDRYFSFSIILLPLLLVLVFFEVLRVCFPPFPKNHLGTVLNVLQIVSAFGIHISVFADVIPTEVNNLEDELFSDALFERKRLFYGLSSIAIFLALLRLLTMLINLDFLRIFSYKIYRVIIVLIPLFTITLIIIIGVMNIFYVVEYPERMLFKCFTKGFGLVFAKTEFDDADSISAYVSTATYLINLFLLNTIMFNAAIWYCRVGIMYVDSHEAQYNNKSKIDAILEGSKLRKIYEFLANCFRQLLAKVSSRPRERNEKSKPMYLYLFMQPDEGDQKISLNMGAQIGEETSNQHAEMTDSLKNKAQVLERRVQYLNDLKQKFQRERQTYEKLSQELELKTSDFSSAKEMMNCEDISLIRQLFIKSKKNLLRKRYASIESVREDLTEWQERLLKKKQQIQELEEEKKELERRIDSLKEASSQLSAKLDEEKKSKMELIAVSNPRFREKLVQCEQNFMHMHIEFKDLAKKSNEKQRELKSLFGENAMFSPVFSKLSQEYFSLWESLSKIKTELEVPGAGDIEADEDIMNRMSPTNRGLATINNIFLKKTTFIES